MLDTEWTRAIANGTLPDADAARNHLEAVHYSHAGFTESCAGSCLDDAGRDSYDWLAETTNDAAIVDILDLACGSGVLLERLARRKVEARLTGVDMSASELALAQRRLDSDRVVLHHAMAQDLGVLENASMDAVLCHWALTLMNPIAPVLTELSRILRPDGVFAAIVDGPIDIAPGYAAINELISDHVRRAFPLYGAVELGDPRVRDSNSLRELACSAFPGARVSVEANVVSMNASPSVLAREVAGFFYCAFMISKSERIALIDSLTNLFDKKRDFSTFYMPINRLIVKR